MALTIDQRQTLRQAIKDYDFPFVTFDFSTKRQVNHPSMREVEFSIRQQLLADDLQQIKNGFSNVLFWGYARMGYRWKRIDIFRNKVTEVQLHKASETLKQLTSVGAQQIVELKLPQVSGFSFISKVRMFLDPANYVVMDIQIMKLRSAGLRTVLDKVVHKEEETIRVTKVNQSAYEAWCNLCRRIAVNEFNTENLRAVDIERGIFQLIQTDRLQTAAQIVSST